MKFSEMPYTRPDMDKLAAGLASLRNQLQNAPDGPSALAVYRAFESQKDAYETQANLAYIRHTLDTADPFYDAENDFFDGANPQVEEMEQGFYDDLLVSPHRPALEQALGTLVFTNIELSKRAFSPAIVSDLQEENRLSSAYGKLLASAQIPFDGKVLTRSELSFYKEHTDRAVRKAAFEADAAFLLSHGEELDDIFDKLVMTRDKMARALGFSDFIAMGYCRMTRNCYGPSEVSAFRAYVHRQIVPQAAALKAQQAARLDLSELTIYDDNLYFPDGNAKPKGTPEEIFQNGQKMYTELSAETGEFFDFMLQNELLDVLSRKGKEGGGYCHYLPDYQSPFIFANFNGTFDDIDVLTHEAGHAFAGYTARNAAFAAHRQPTAEAAEVHSTAMEFFTYPWMSSFFGEQTAKYQKRHDDFAIGFLPYGVMVDEFQHEIYASPALTPKERHGVWLALEQKYRPWLSQGGLPFYGEGRRWQVQAHIYQIPFYYIDYCLAFKVALSFYELAKKDRTDAWRRYLTFVQKAGAATFTELVAAAGLPSPFLESTP